MVRSLQARSIHFELDNETQEGLKVSSWYNPDGASEELLRQGKSYMFLTEQDFINFRNLSSYLIDEDFNAFYSHMFGYPDVQDTHVYGNTDLPEWMISMAKSKLGHDILWRVDITHYGEDDTVSPTHTATFFTYFTKPDYVDYFVGQIKDLIRENPDFNFRHPNINIVLSETQVADHSRNAINSFEELDDYIVKIIKANGMLPKWYCTQWTVDTDNDKVTSTLNHIFDTREEAQQFYADFSGDRGGVYWPGSPFVTTVSIPGVVEDFEILFSESTKFHSAPDALKGKDAAGLK